MSAADERRLAQASSAASAATACFSRSWLLILFGWLRYDNFLGAFNVLTVLRYNSHVRADRAGHVLRHHDRRHRPVGRLDRGLGQRRRGPALVPTASCPGLLGGWRGARRSACSTAFIITRLEHPALHRDAGDHAGGERHARCCSPTTSRSRSPTNRASPSSARAISSAFPIPAWIALVAYLLGSLVLNLTAFGRNVLAVGGGEDAARLMGLPVDRVKVARLPGERRAWPASPA